MSDQEILNQFLSDIYAMLSKYCITGEESIEIFEKDEYREIVIKNDEWESELTVRSAEEEITVSFDSFHTHFGLVRDGTIDTDDAKRITETIIGILSDRLVVLAKNKKEKWAGSTLVDYTFSNDKEKVTAFKKDCDRVFMKSWSENRVKLDF